MPRFILKIIIVLVLLLSAIAIGALVFFPLPWNSNKNRVEQQARMIIPRTTTLVYEDLDNAAENLAREDSFFSKVELEDGEVLVSVITDYFDGGPMEKQFVAYRNLLEIDSPVYLTYIDYDEETRNYVRVWEAQTAATRPGTINLYTQDLLGDRSLCVLLHGMNGQGQHTLTIFRKNPYYSGDPSNLFSKIAELMIDGNITVRENTANRPNQGVINQGSSYIISTFGRDMESANLLDQIEINYAFNEKDGCFEEISLVHIPGTQVEQRRLRELLGNVSVFEDFITGLWYHMTAQGNVNTSQYIYFDNSNREIIFYEDETQQVFNWTNSTATRVGLYITSQNISVTTLRRSIDIELESMDSLRIRVIEDVRLKFGVNTPWDGSYRKASPLENQVKALSYENSHLDALYEGQMGKIRFLPDGSFEISSGTSLRQGKYAFFYLNDLELLEFRPNELRNGDLRSDDLRGADLGYSDPHSDGIASREVYLVEGDDSDSPRSSLTLSRVRIGSRGVEKLLERAIPLNLVSE